MQKVIAIIVVLVAIAGGVYYFTAKNVESPEDGIAPVSNNMPVPGEEGVDEMIVNDDSDKTVDGGLAAEKIVVTIGADGKFTPNTIKIKKGETVTWKNNTSQFIWPASAIHPTHLIYPEFDSKKGIAPGSEYSFKFDKAWSWKYHDHLKPSAFGTIEVSELKPKNLL